MNGRKRRKYDRKKTLNLVDYVVLGEGGEQVSRGMGRTRNVSEGGLLLETYHPLNAGQEVLITLGLQDDLVELKGRIVHLEPPVPPSEKDRHCSGVEFTGVDKQGLQILRRYIEAISALQKK
ncbi:MAG: PilZ domain-containing protein [Desulfobacteraceae bacterium]